MQQICGFRTIHEEAMLRWRLGQRLETHQEVKKILRKLSRSAKGGGQLS